MTTLWVSKKPFWIIDVDVSSDSQSLIPTCSKHRVSFFTRMIPNQPKSMDSMFSAMQAPRVFVEDSQPLLRSFDEFQSLSQLDPNWNTLCRCFGLLQRVLEHLELGPGILSQHFESPFQLLNSLPSGGYGLFGRKTCGLVATGLSRGFCAAVWIAPTTTWSCEGATPLPFPFCWRGHWTEGSRDPRMTLNQPSGTGNELHPLHGIQPRLTKTQKTNKRNLLDWTTHCVTTSLREMAWAKIPFYTTHTATSKYHLVVERDTWLSWTIS